jgi:hypothetical protein
MTKKNDLFQREGTQAGATQFKKIATFIELRWNSDLHNRGLAQLTEADLR